MSTDYNDPKVKQAVLAWKKNASILEDINKTDILNLDTLSALESLSELFEQAIRDFPPENSSGLVEQQAWFQKQRNKITNEITS